MITRQGPGIDNDECHAAAAIRKYPAPTRGSIDEHPEPVVDPDILEGDRDRVERAWHEHHGPVERGDQ